jgi:hypothetical protein
MPKAARPKVSKTDRTVAERGAKFREEKASQGLMQCLVWVPRDRCPEMKALAEILCADRDLMPGPPRSIRTSRQVRTTNKAAP